VSMCAYVVEIEFKRGREIRVFQKIQIDNISDFIAEKDPLCTSVFNYGKFMLAEEYQLNCI